MQVFEYHDIHKDTYSELPFFVMVSRENKDALRSSKIDEKLFFLCFNGDISSCHKIPVCFKGKYLLIY